MRILHEILALGAIRKTDPDLSMMKMARAGMICRAAGATSRHLQINATFGWHRRISLFAKICGLSVPESRRYLHVYT